MKDIKVIIQDDIGNLKKAFATGELTAGSRPLAGYFSEEELQSLSGDILQYIVENKVLSLFMSVLSTMKWLTLTEACLYARKSRNTILELINKTKIYGSKPNGGDYIIDRESIDAYYNYEKHKLQEKVRTLNRRIA